jgi:hypothetical protein
MYSCGLLQETVAKKREIPLEIDDHFKLFGKEPWEVDYGEKCPICNVRIDEYGFCSCFRGLTCFWSILGNSTKVEIILKRAP